jgi:hypothetical protein
MQSDSAAKRENCGDAACAAKHETEANSAPRQCQRSVF